MRVDVYLCTDFKSKVFMCMFRYSCNTYADADFLTPFHYLSFFRQKSSYMYVAQTATMTARARIKTHIYGGLF